jgi:tetratricopeptide (TPR) repeat protein
MKKLVVIFVFVCFSQISFAKDKDKTLFIKAKELIKTENFSEAISVLKVYAKDLGEIELKEMYLDLANAYYSMNYKAEALKNIKLAITKAGLTEQDFIYTEILTPEVSNFAWEYFYENFTDLRKEYLKK